MSEYSYIDCKSAYLRLNDFLDHELTEEEIVLVKAHLKKCHVCAVEYEFEDHLLEQIRKKICQSKAPDDLRIAVKALCQKAKLSPPEEP